MYAGLCGVMRGYARLCAVMRGYARLCAVYARFHGQPQKFFPLQAAVSWACGAPPRSSQDAHQAPQEPPKQRSRCPRESPERPGRLESAPQDATRHPRHPQDSPQGGPRRLQDAPCPQDAPKLTLGPQRSRVFLCAPLFHVWYKYH